MTLCWTVEDVKAHLDLEDSSDPDIDQKLEQAMAITVSTIERYCNRLFVYREDHTETVYKTNGNGWQLHLWPVKNNRIWVNGQPSQIKVDNQTGVAWFDSYSRTDMCDVLYSGGFEGCDWPQDLLAVLYGSIKNGLDMVTGEVTHSSSISKVTIPDVGTVTYDNKTSGSINHGGVLIGGLVPSNWQSTLDFYRLHEC